MLGVFNLLSLLISMYLCVSACLCGVWSMLMPILTYPSPHHLHHPLLQVRLISPSVIMTYANDNMAYLLVLPAGCCCGISLYLFSHSGKKEA
jgi:hypothetical protein